jgi:hypothetical protein
LRFDTGSVLHAPTPRTRPAMIVSKYFLMVRTPG